MKTPADGITEHRVDLAAFYDENPYPPPARDLESEKERWADGARRRAEYHLTWPLSTYREDLDVLIAGCGTSQAARYALRYPGARVVGIDVSEASLRHTRELGARHGLTNLELHRLPIEQVEELDQRFDQIVCTGVLHHLADPIAALRRLTSTLRAEGAAQLMVYATYGRVGVSMLQAYCRRLSIASTAAEIRAVAETLSCLPSDHPLVPLLVNSPDFRQPAGLADALLHPRERSYTVPELYELVEDAGLSFGRWYQQAPDSARCGAVAETPHADRLAGLAEPEQYAAVELLRGTLVRHTAIAYPSASRHAEFRAHFAGEMWRGFVPIRLPDSICAEPREQTPADATAVLINTTHAHNDLILPIDEPQLKMVQAIDGRRTISEIIASGRDANADADTDRRARELFERLWLCDQVVFEIPGSPDSAE